MIRTVIKKRLRMGHEGIPKNFTGVCLSCNYTINIRPTVKLDEFPCPLCGKIAYLNTQGKHIYGKNESFRLNKKNSNIKDALNKIKDLANRMIKRIKNR